MTYRTCKVEGCGKSVGETNRRICATCRGRWAKYRSFAKPTRPSLEQRFWKKVAKTDGCWEWVGSRSGGYGRLWVRKGRFIAAHRLSLQLAGIEIPEGYQVDHLCRNKGCVNPDHLEPVTTFENFLRAASSVPITKGTDLSKAWRQFQLDVVQRHT